MLVEDLEPLSDAVIVECLEATGMIANRCENAPVRLQAPPQEVVLCVSTWPCLPLRSRARSLSVCLVLSLCLSLSPSLPPSIHPSLPPKGSK